MTLRHLSILPLGGLVLALAAILVAPGGDRPFLAAATLVAALAGLAATSIGVFGAVLVPGLLLLGVDPRFAAALSLLLQAIAIPIGASSHAAVGHVRRAIVVPLIAGGVVGAVCGALVASSVPADLIARVIALIIVVIGCIVLANLRGGSAASVAGPAVGPARIGGIGLVAGLASGMSGAGWGPIGVKLLILGRIEPRLAVGSSLVGRVAMAVAALAAYAAGAGVLGAALASPALVAVLLGGSIATMIPGTLLIARLGRGPAAAFVAVLSIGLALPTMVGWT